MAMTLSQWLAQLKLMIGRNIVLKRRAKSETLREMVMPVFFFVILIFLKSSLPIIQRSGEGVSNTISLENKLEDYLLTDVLLYGPAEHCDRPPGEDSDVGRIIEHVRLKQSAGARQNIAFGFGEQDMLRQYQTNTLNATQPVVFAAVVFPSMTCDGSLSQGVDYVIRMDSSLLPDAAASSWTVPPWWQADDTYTKYIDSGFLALQFALDDAVVSTLRTDHQYYSVSVGKMPFNNYTFDPFRTFFTTAGALYMVMGFLSICQRVLVSVVDEKEKKTKIYMQIMGVRESVYYCSWWAVESAVLMVPVLAISVLAQVKQFFPGASPLSVFLLLLLYAQSMVWVGLMLSTLFSKMKLAASVGSLLVFVLYLPYYVPFSSHAGAVCAALSSPVAFSMGLMRLYQTTDGAGLATTLEFQETLWMLLLDSLLYAAATWYLSLVVPGEYGTPKPWHFCVPTPMRCCARRRHGGYDRTEDQTGVEMMASGSSSDASGDQESNEDVEPAPDHLRARVEISNLRKHFDSKPRWKCWGDNQTVRAVDGLSLSCYEGQILALLGHNGAGKSTTVSILTGVYTADAGRVSVDGVNWDDVDESMRPKMGICPQYDVLFDHMDTEEHLVFYARLKGLPEEQVQGEVDRLLTELDLQDARHTKALKLSGGQKRKLSVAVALLGDAEVLFLDEPTAGMDPYSRRKVWSLLQEKKAGRVIILTTHYMDEADLLADRIAIMNSGRMRCVGSSLFLKRRFGIGYHVDMTKRLSSEGDSQCQVRQVTDLVSHAVPGVRVLEETSQELRLVLPLAAVASFADLFQRLEEEKEELGVRDYGISLTTLEEVFLRLADEVDDKPAGVEEAQDEEQEEEDVALVVHDVDNGAGRVRARSNAEAASISSLYDTLPVLCSSAVQQCRGMLHKRWSIARRDARSLWLQLGVPVVYVLLLVSTLKGVPAGSSTSPLSLTSPPAVFSDRLFPVGGTSESAQHAFDLLSMSATPLHLVSVPPADSLLSWSSDLLRECHASDGQSCGGALYAERVLMTEGVPPPTTTVAALLANSSTVHSLPCGLAALTGALVGNQSVSFSASSHPFPTLHSAPLSVAGFLIPLMLGLTFTYPPIALAAALVKEKECKAKHQQMVMGLRPWVFWSMNLLFDCVCMFVPVSLVLLLFTIFGIHGLSGANAVACLVLFASFNTAVLCFNYAVGMLFKRTRNFQTSASLIGSFVCVLLFVVAAGGEALSYSIAEFVAWLPNFNLMWGLHELVQLQERRAAKLLWCSSVECGFSWLDAFAWDVTGMLLVYNVVVSAVCLASLLAVEYGYVGWPGSGRSRAYEHVDTQVLNRSRDEHGERSDQDVEDERTRVEEGRADQDLVRLTRLNKAFETKQSSRIQRQFKVAVDGVSLAIPNGQTFGLLGPNGAGKSTIINMLTGDVVPTSGDAFVGPLSTRHNLPAIYSTLGYCPQSEGLMELLTGREHLVFYARVKGIPESHISGVVQAYLRSMDLQEHAKKPSKKYSGGNQRKLNTAISLMGRPALLLLDEPSTGMDPHTRRKLWDVISHTMRDRCCLLTTHSMEEADALCDRLAIMVNGRLQCLGSSQHLKSLHGGGYELELSLSPSHRTAQHEQAVRDMAEGLAGEGGCTQLECFGGRLTFSLQRGAQAPPLHVLFRTLEDSREALGVEDYSLSQTTLEQVFVHFARMQAHEVQE